MKKVYYTVEPTATELAVFYQGQHRSAISRITELFGLCCVLFWGFMD